MKGIEQLIGFKIKDIKVIDLEKYKLYSGLKLLDYLNLGKTKQGRWKRLYLYKQNNKYSELFEGVDYNTLQVSVYKKIIIEHEKDVETSN